jgi:hypothetical protein
MLEIFATASRHHFEAAQEHACSTQAALEASTAELLAAQSSKNATQARYDYLLQLLVTLSNASAAAAFAQSQRKLAVNLQSPGGTAGREAPDIQVCCLHLLSKDYRT